jgi:hypothetical protein
MLTTLLHHRCPAAPSPLCHPTTTPPPRSGTSTYSICMIGPGCTIYSWLGTLFFWLDERSLVLHTVLTIHMPISSWEKKVTEIKTHFYPLKNITILHLSLFIFYILRIKYFKSYYMFHVHHLEIRSLGTNTALEAVPRSQ